MPYDFNTSPNRRPTDSIKWNLYGADVLPFWVADMDFTAPLPVIEALQSRISHGIFGYACQPAELASLICQRLDQLYQWKVQPSSILFLPNVHAGFNLAAQAVTQPGDAMLLLVPVYQPMLTTAKNAGLHRQDVELSRTPSGQYQIDFDALEQAITDETRLLLLCNPHNPVGRVFSHSELEHLADIALRYNLSICSDEIHCDLLFDNRKHIPIASLSPQVSARTITLMAPSKTYNIPGLNCAFAIVEDETLRNQVNAARRGLVGGANPLGVIAALAAYQHGDEWLSELLSYLQSNRDFLTQFVLQNLPGIRISPIEATYLAWLDCTALDLQPSPFQFFLDQAKVALMDGAVYGPGGKGFVRLNFGCPRVTLEKGLLRMQQALQEL